MGPGSDLAVRQSVGKQGEHVDFTTRQAIGRGRCARLWSARNVTSTKFSESSAHALRHRRGPQCDEPVQRVTERRLLVGVGQRHRRLVWRTESLPPRGGTGEIAGDVQRVPLGRLVRQRSGFDAELPRPPTELADRVAHPGPNCLLHDTHEVASDLVVDSIGEPRDLNTRHDHWPEPLHVLGGNGQPPRTIQFTCHTG